MDSQDVNSSAGGAGTIRWQATNHALLPGHFADPALVALDGRFWIYPTTDGTPGWSSTSFRAFSSSDLVKWTDHGEVFSVSNGTSWASGHAWAPAMSEHDGHYFFYFTAENNIGVAVGRSPLGPFTDLGEPLVAAGRFSGVAIDPAVFTDDDGRAYLYWGNGTAHGVELDAMMTGFDSAAVCSWQPNGFREAPWVHRRGNVYYLSWSENDTREADYRVCYATSDRPLGPWTDRGILIEQDRQRGILATGHHSILRLPGTDDWVVAYHRFAIPNGDGHHREVVLDRLVHRTDGLLEPVQHRPLPNLEHDLT